MVKYAPRSTRVFKDDRKGAGRETRSVAGATRLNLTRYRFRYSPDNWAGWVTGRRSTKKMEAARATRRFLLLATSWSPPTGGDRKGRKEEGVEGWTRTEWSRRGVRRWGRQARGEKTKENRAWKAEDEEEANECRLTVRGAWISCATMYRRARARALVNAIRHV